MKKNGKWLVALDFSRMDKDIFWSLNELKNRLEPSEITFVHVIKTSGGLHFLFEDLAGLRLIMAEERRLELQSWVDNLIEGESTDYDYKVLHGDPFHEINRLADKLGADLIMMGKKGFSNHDSVTDRLRIAQPTKSFVVLENKEGELIDQI